MSLVPSRSPLGRLLFLNNFRVDNRAIGFPAVVWSAFRFRMHSGLASSRPLPWMRLF